MIAIGIIGLVLLTASTLGIWCIYVKVDEIAQDYPRGKE